MYVIKHIKVDLFGAPQRYAVTAKQGDKATRWVGVTLQQDGQDFLIPADVEILVSITKPDGHHVWNECSRDNNEVLIPLTNQTLAAPGTALVDVELKTNDETLSSATFELEIYKSQRDEEAIESSDEYTHLEIAIQRAKDALQAANDALAHTLEQDALVAAAEEARAKAERLRVAAEEARQQNTAAAIAACEQATADSIRATAACDEATAKTVAILMMQEDLNAAVEAIKDYYERIRQTEKDVNLLIDGGTATSKETLLIKGGTAYSTDYDKLLAGNAYTI